MKLVSKKVKTGATNSESKNKPDRSMQFVSSTLINFYNFQKFIIAGAGRNMHDLKYSCQSSMKLKDLK